MISLCRSEKFRESSNPSVCAESNDESAIETIAPLISKSLGPNQQCPGESYAMHLPKWFLRLLHRTIPIYLGISRLHEFDVHPGGFCI